VAVSWEVAHNDPSGPHVDEFDDGSSPHGARRAEAMQQQHRRVTLTTLLDVHAHAGEHYDGNVRRRAEVPE
jgi:hypothetical protein